MPRVREFIARFLPDGANYLEWDSIAQAITSPTLATDLTPMIDAYGRIFGLGQ